MTTVPFLKPDLPPWADIEGELRETYDRGRFHPAEYTRRAEAAFAETLGVKHALMLSTCADGLILLLARVSAAHRNRRPFVAVPAFTFRATPQAAWWANCDMVVVDCDETGNMDPEALAHAVRMYPLDAVLAVHVFGLPCEHDALAEAAPGIPIFYDAAHAMGAELPGGRRVASLGAASIYSLNITKTVPSAGEGGLLATDDDDIAEWMRQARWHGAGAGSLDWILPGMNAKPTEWQAIVAYHALKRMPEVIGRRRAAVARYRDLLDLSDACMPMQDEPPGVRSAWKDFAVIFPTPDHREAAEKGLREAGVEFKRYFCPIVSKMGAYSGIVASDAVAANLAETVLCLPIYSTITPEQQETVVGAILEAVED